jgi:MtrB/PioB family decaheme-associated outer membrane protein
MDRKLLVIAVVQALAVGSAAAQQAAPATPAPAADADPFQMTGSVSVGGTHTDTTNTPDASKLNEYRDLSNGTLIGFDAKGRSSQYWLDLFGENLGRDDEYVNLRGGMYDIFKYRLYTDALRHNFLFGGITPYSGAGSTNLTATFPSLDTTKWNSLDMSYKRRDTGAMFEWQQTSPFYFRVDANQVDWGGTKPGASSQGTSPGNGFVELPLPVDYKTRNATAEVGYNTRTMHFDLQYLYSKFDNANDKVNWVNGYFGNGIDTTYLAPDNKYQKLTGNATWRQLPYGSSISARFTTDKLDDNVTLGTSVLNGTAGQISPVTANQGNFNGQVRNNTFTFAVDSSPMRALDTHLYYNYRKRDDNSSVITYTTPDAATSEPFSYTKNNAGINAYYRLDRANRFGAGYDYLHTDRTGRPDYDETKDNTFFAEWKNTSLDDLAARFKYTRLQRRSNFLYANSGSSTTDPAWENRYITAFDLSNVNQDNYKVTLDYTAWQRLDLGFEGIYKQNKYQDNVLGRLKDKRAEVYLSASYAFPNGARFTVFGDNEEIKYDSQHRIVGNGALDGAYEPLSPPNASNYNWTGNIKDRNYAVGGAFDWPVTDKFYLKASAIYYRTDGNVDLALQQGVPSSITPPAPIPNWDDTKRTSISLKGVYNLNKAWSFTAGYAYERYEYSDIQYDGYRYTIPSSSRQDSYLNGVYAQPQNKANIVYGLATYHF